MTGIPDSNKYRNREFWLAMAILVGISSLPFFNELITIENGSIQHWLMSPEFQDSLKKDGRILDYSKFSVLLYYLLIQIYILTASIGWFTVAKDKAYRYALLLCTSSSAYHIFLILSENRKTWLNEAELKLWSTLALSAVLFAFYIFSELRKRRLLKGFNTTLGAPPKRIVTAKVIFAWLSITAISTFPYFHDIISPRGLGIQDWVPFDGFESLVKLGEKNYWGFRSYRALVLTIFVQLFAQLMWAGWWLDAKYSVYKPFLLVPLGLSFFELTMILMVQKDAYLNKPDTKLFLVLAFGVFLGILYYFKNKKLATRQPSITDIVPQNQQYKKHMK